MRVAGCDFSSFFVDVVTVPLDEGAPVWHRFPLTGQDAFDRARSVADAMPSRSSALWEDVIGVGIEHPAGHHGTGVLMRVQGAILARLPAATLVVPLPPSRWRQLVGLKGNASKDDVAGFVFTEHENYPLHASDASLPVWPQDACDAHCIALATRSLIEQKQAA